MNVLTYLGDPTLVAQACLRRPVYLNSVQRRSCLVAKISTVKFLIISIFLKGVNVLPKFGADLYEVLKILSMVCTLLSSVKLHMRTVVSMDEIKLDSP